VRLRADSTGRIIPRVKRIRAFVAAALLAGIAAAFAHPMGNFSINRWTKLTARAGGVEVIHLIDFAEVPTQVEFAVARITEEPKGRAAEICYGHLHDCLDAHMARALSPPLALDTRGRTDPAHLRPYTI
jgi:hypothetical protein